jgi:hypothetical protein
MISSSTPRYLDNSDSIPRNCGDCCKLGCGVCYMTTGACYALCYINSWLSKAFLLKASSRESNLVYSVLISLPGSVSNYWVAILGVAAWADCLWDCTIASMTDWFKERFWLRNFCNFFWSFICFIFSDWLIVVPTYESALSPAAEVYSVSNFYSSCY